MAMEGRVIANVFGAAFVCALGLHVHAGEPAIRTVPGHVVMPHPNACACANEDKGFCDGLWDKLRPGHRDRYVTRQNSRHLNNPECPPWCMENFGYYQTCWRRFPEHTLGCRYCDTSGSPPLPAAPLPAATYPVPAAPPAPPTLPPADLRPVPPMEYDAPPMEYDTPPNQPQAEPSEAPITQTINPMFKDPRWQAGLRD